MADDLLTQIEQDLLSERSLADALRKCIILGGRSGSHDLRDWAAQELRGYRAEGATLPPYRRVPAAICLDAIVGNYHQTAQPISPRALPDFTHDTIREEVGFPQGVGEIEALIRNAHVNNKPSLKFSLPMSNDLARVMDAQNDNPYQRITALYWEVSIGVAEGIVDQIRTTLAELVSEMRAGTPRMADPSADVATQAVNVVVHGEGATVNVSPVHAEGSASVAVPHPDHESGWTARKVAAVIVGVATVGALPVGIFQWTDWAPWK